MRKSKSFISLNEILEPLDYEPSDKYLKSMVFALELNHSELTELNSISLMGNQGLAFLGQKAIMEKVAPSLAAVLEGTCLKTLRQKSRYWSNLMNQEIDYELRLNSVLLFYKVNKRIEKEPLMMDSSLSLKESL